MPIKEILSLIQKQSAQIDELNVKCANLEAINMCLTASIACTSPDIAESIKQNAEVGLHQLVEQNLGESDLASKLRAVAGISAEKKPHLWLVPPKP